MDIIYIPPSLVLGCNNPVSVNALSDFIEEATGIPLDLMQSGFCDGPNYTRLHIYFEYNKGDGRNYGLKNGDGISYGRPNGNGYSREYDQVDASGQVDGNGTGRGYGYEDGDGKICYAFD